MGGEWGAQRVFPGEHGEQAEHPTRDGWSTEKLAEARGIARGAGSTALLVIHRGQIVLEYGDTTTPTMVASVRKSLISALYGIHVAAGTIDLSTTMDELGIDDNEPSLTPDREARDHRRSPESALGHLPSVQRQQP